MYSGVGEHELSKFYGDGNWRTFLEEVPASIREFPYWTYGPPGHSSKGRQIIGSLMILTACNEGHVDVRHMVMEGSTQWVYGGNVVSYCNINHIEDRLEFSNGTYIPMYKENRLSYIQLDRFSLPKNPNFEGAKASTPQTEAPRANMDELAIVEKVHDYSCGHSNYSDQSELLK